MIIRNPYAVPGQYRKAQLHCHTTNSDGRFRPDELLRMYKDAGYTFVCITDHDHVTHYEELNDERFLALPATEDTVSLLRPLGPHMGRLFVDESLRTGSAQERIDRTIAANGIVSLCHPSWTGNLWTGAWTMQSMLSLRGFHLMEIWNPHSNSSEDVRRWSAALRARGLGVSIWGVAVDDCHHQGQFNLGWITVKVSEVSREALRRALMAGSFYASTGPSAEFDATDRTIEVRLVEGGSVPKTVPIHRRSVFRRSTIDDRPSPIAIRFIDREGRLRTEVRGPEGHYSVRGDEGYVRVECQGAHGQAWSQPFWIENAQLVAPT